MVKIGILGGAFDPPHKGHMNAVAEFAKAYDPVKIFIIPSGTSKHKTVETSYDARLSMTRDYFDGASVKAAGIKCPVEVLDIEKGGNCFTYITLKKLKKLYGNNSYHFIIGSDQLYDFNKWYRHESLSKEAIIVAVPRKDGEYIDMLEEATKIGRIKCLNIPVVDISSTELRQASSGQSARLA